jgi:parvulin-like peptidyl-prolyl isomerase
MTSLARSAISLALIGFAALAAPQAVQAVTPIDRIVAVINHEVILASELEERIATIRMQVEEQGTTLPPDSVLRRQVLDRMIDEELQLQRGRSAGVRIPDDELNQALAQIASRNDMTLADLPQALAQQGIDYAGFREQIRRDMILEEVQENMLVREVSVSDREVQEFLAQAEARGQLEAEYEVSHIMLNVSSSARSEEVRDTRDKVRELHRRLQDGGNFAELAMTYSEGRQALEGGSLGWRRGPELPTMFAERVVNMTPGQFTEPFRTSSGFHIIRLDDVRRGNPVVVEERLPVRVQLGEHRDLVLRDLHEPTVNGDPHTSLLRLEEQTLVMQRGKERGVSWENPDVAPLRSGQNEGRVPRPDLAFRCDDRHPKWHGYSAYSFAFSMQAADASREASANPFTMMPAIFVTSRLPRGPGWSARPA